MQTVAAVKQAYWTLKATRPTSRCSSARSSWREELARENKVRVDVGQIPPLDLVQAEAEVAQRRENLIRANTIAEDAEDALRRLIVDPSDVAFWRCGSSRSENRPVIVTLPDVDAAVAKALDERYDIARAGHELENAQTTWSSSTTSGCRTCGSRRRIAATGSAARSSCDPVGFPAS